MYQNERRQCNTSIVPIDFMSANQTLSLFCFPRVHGRGADSPNKHSLGSLVSSKSSPSMTSSLDSHHSPIEGTNEKWFGFLRWDDADQDIDGKISFRCCNGHSGQ